MTGFRRRLLDGAWLCVSLALARPADAAAPASLDATLQGQARSDYDAARLLYEIGDYGGALLKFQAAFDESGDPQLLWNAAACERSLRHYVKAAELVRRFVERRSADLTLEEAAEAQAFLDAAAPLTAPFSVEASPTAAAIWLDDEPLGSLPLPPSARIDIGKHRVLVRARGYRDFDQRLTVSGHAPVNLQVTLRPLEVLRRDTHAPPRLLASRPGLPVWAWLAGGGVLLAGALTAGYFALKHDPAEPLPGSIATYRF